jgi:hypothetical protein
LPHEGLFRHGADRGFAAELGHANRADRNAVDRDVPLLAGELAQRSGRRTLVAVNAPLECAGERARGMLGWRSLRGLRRAERSPVARGRRWGVLERRRHLRRRRRDDGVLAFLEVVGRRKALRDARLGDRGFHFDEVPALAALHSHGLSRDLLVGDLVLGFAVVAEEFHAFMDLDVGVIGSWSGREALRLLCGITRDP